MENPLLTVVIPTYNSEKSLEKCLESVIRQTAKNIEIWIIDGGSHDGTLSLIERYSLKYRFIKFISEKDKGIYDAMNKGIDRATGEWLYFLGSDDYLINESVVKAVLSNENIETADFIYGDVIWGNSGNRYAGKFNWLKILKGNICHQAIFYKKTIFDRLGRYNISYPVLADHDLNMKIFQSSLKTLYVDTVIAFFTLDGASSKVVSDPLQIEAAENNRKLISAKSLRDKLLYYYILTPDRDDLKSKLRRTLLRFIFFLRYWRDVESETPGISYSFPWSSK